MDAFDRAIQQSQQQSDRYVRETARRRQEFLNNPATLAEFVRRTGNGLGVFRTPFGEREARMLGRNMPTGAISQQLTRGNVSFATTPRQTEQYYLPPRRILQREACVTTPLLQFVPEPLFGSTYMPPVSDLKLNDGNYYTVVCEDGITKREILDRITDEFNNEHETGLGGLVLAEDGVRRILLHEGFEYLATAGFFRVSGGPQRFVGYRPYETPLLTPVDEVASEIMENEILKFDRDGTNFFMFRMSHEAFADDVGGSANATMPGRRRALTHLDLHPTGRVTYRGYIFAQFADVERQSIDFDVNMFLLSNPGNTVLSYGVNDSNFPGNINFDFSTIAESFEISMSYDDALIIDTNLVTDGTEDTPDFFTIFNLYLVIRQATYDNQPFNFGDDFGFDPSD